MKLGKILIICLGLLVLASCGNKNEELIVGTWKEVDTGESISHYYKDGTFLDELDNGKDERGTYYIDGDEIVQVYEGETDELRSTLSILDETTLQMQFMDMFQTTYERVKE